VMDIRVECATSAQIRRQLEVPGEFLACSFSTGFLLFVQSLLMPLKQGTGANSFLMKRLHFWRDDCLRDACD